MTLDYYSYSNALAFVCILASFLTIILIINEKDRDRSIRLHVFILCALAMISCSTFLVSDKNVEFRRKYNACLDSLSKIPEDKRGMDSVKYVEYKDNYCLALAEKLMRDDTKK